MAKSSTPQPGNLPPITTTPAAAARLRKLAAQVAQRKCEALALYEPLPHVVPFHASMARERLVFGSNRAGKTLVDCVEIARAVTGQDPYNKWPKTDGRFYLVGFDEKHLGQVFYRKLFRAGAFKIIRDQAGQWRAYRPWEPWDLQHAHEVKLAPPLIPSRFIKHFAWKNKKTNTPEFVLLHNGWELMFFSSKAAPPQGVDLDGVLFDEEIENRLWYEEMAARLLDRKGRFIWGATPQAATEEMLTLYQRATKHKSANVHSFEMSIYQNPHVDEEEKRLLEEKFPPGTAAHETRVLGKFAALGMRVYPEFEPEGIHAVDPFPIPADWTRYVSIDPGHQVCAVLFAAVPPPGDPRGDHLFLTDELYLHRCDAVQFGEAMGGRSQNVEIEDMIIDHQMSRQTEVASGKSIEVQYSDALGDHHVKSNRRGTGFAYGSSDVQAGIESVKKMLRIRKSGTPKIKYFKGQLPNFCDEISKHRRKRDKDGTVIDDIVRKNDHLMSCLRMLCAYEPTYVKPKRHIARDPVLNALAAKRRRARETRGQDAGYVRLGPGQP